MDSLWPTVFFLNKLENTKFSRFIREFELAICHDLKIGTLIG
jgi:hypothetical protein